MSDETAALFHAELELLGRQCKRLRREAWLWRLGTVASLCAISLVVWWSNRPVPAPKDGRFDTVRTKDFSLVDADGFDLARLYTVDGVTTLQMSSSGRRDTNRVVIAAGETGGVIMLKDQKEMTRILASTPPDGPRLVVASDTGTPNVLLTTNSKGGNLTLLNSNGMGQVRAGLDESGVAGISLWDNQEHNRANLSLHRTGEAQISLIDPTNKTRLVTGWNVEGDRRPALALVDERGVIRGTFGLFPHPASDRLAPAIRLYDEKGATVFSAP